MGYGIAAECRTHGWEGDKQRAVSLYRSGGQRRGLFAGPAGLFLPSGRNQKEVVLLILVALVGCASRLKIIEDGCSEILSAGQYSAGDRLHQAQNPIVLCIV
jgi:hypothetical protein